jgi:hypothetical protein
MQPTARATKKSLQVASNIATLFLLLLSLTFNLLPLLSPRSTHLALFNISPTQTSSSEAATISGLENATTGQSGPNNINITALQDLPPPTDPGSEYTTNNTARGPERRDSKSNSSTTVEESGSDVEGQPTVLVGVMREYCLAAVAPC